MKSVKRQQREAHILRQMAPILQDLFKEHEVLKPLFVSRLELSSSGTKCLIFFSTFTTQEAFRDAWDTLILYKPSIRAALSNILNSRYTPEVRFEYDAAKEKERRLNEIFDSIHAKESEQADELK